MKNKNIRIYSFFGKVLCASAGGIVGFILVGPVIAVAGTLIGALAGYFLKKRLLEESITRTIKKTL